MFLPYLQILGWTDKVFLYPLLPIVSDQESFLLPGVFRADIPCRFRLVAEAFQKLHDDVDRCIRRAIEVEENIPLDQVGNIFCSHELADTSQ